MYSTTILAFVLTVVGFAKQCNTRSLTDVLAANSDSLSSFSRLIGTLPPAFVAQLTQATDITILAPNNEALDGFLNAKGTAEAIAADPGLVTAVVSYHVLKGIHYESDLAAAASASKNNLFIPTLLANGSYTKVSGGQRVQVTGDDDSSPLVVSGLKALSRFTKTNLNITSGTIHVIDRVLTIPQGVGPTLRFGNLTGLLGAVQKANLASTLSEAKDITVFAPTNDAFDSVSSIVADLNQTELQTVLGHHVSQGKVLYSTQIESTTVRSLGKKDLNISVFCGSIFVDGGQVISPDILISNGVVHTINRVLLPDRPIDPLRTMPIPVRVNPVSGGVRGGRPPGRFTC